MVVMIDGANGSRGQGTVYKRAKSSYSSLPDPTFGLAIQIIFAIEASDLFTEAASRHM